MEDIDAFESLKTFSTEINDSNFGSISEINIINAGTGYTNAFVNIISDTGTGATATATLDGGSLVSVSIISSGSGYKDATIIISGDGSNATAEAVLSVDVDQIDSYGDNNSLRKEADNILWDENNPFGDV